MTTNLIATFELIKALAELTTALVNLPWADIAAAVLNLPWERLLDLVLRLPGGGWLC